MEEEIKLTFEECDADDEDLSESSSPVNHVLTASINQNVLIKDKGYVKPKDKNSFNTVRDFIPQTFMEAVGSAPRDVIKRESNFNLQLIKTKRYRKVYSKSPKKRKGLNETSKSKSNSKERYSTPIRRYKRKKSKLSTFCKEPMSASLHKKSTKFVALTDLGKTKNVKKSKKPSSPISESKGRIQSFAENDKSLNDLKFEHNITFGDNELDEMLLFR